MSGIWKRVSVDWHRPASWAAPLSRWSKPRLRKVGPAPREVPEPDVPWDDPAWRRLASAMLRPPPEEVAELLGDALSFASAKTFHGCRVDDAGVYLREGLRRNDPAAMVASLRALLETEGRLNAIRDKVEFRLSQRSLVERDKGNLYLVLDDKSLIEFAGHYLIYGSEWMMALLGAAGHDVLRGRGIPTMLEVDLPLAAAAERDRVDLANILLTEWARRKVARHAEAPELDFAFCLRADVPPEWVVGHYHPASVRDVHYGWIPRRSARTRCAACAPR